MVDRNELFKAWNQHSAKLLLIARAIGEPAEDAVQEAFLRLAEQKQPPEETLAWLVRVVRNQLISWHRTNARRQAKLFENAARKDWFVGTPCEDSLDAKRVVECLQQLNEFDRQIVVMHLWGELSFDQISKIVNVSRSSVHRIYQQALQHLRESLK
jgi:RNA polymerase sigma factor (sigma-70 family)